MQRVSRDLQPIEELCPYVLCSPCRADPALSGMTPVLGCRRTYSFSPHKQTYLWWHTSGILCEPGHGTYTPEYIARRLRNRQQSAVRSTGAPDPCRGHGDDRHHVAQAPRPATTLSRFLDSARILKMSLMAEYLIFQFSEISTSASFHSSTANSCAHSIFCRRNTHIPSDLGFWNPAPRDRGRSHSGF